MGRPTFDFHTAPRLQGGHVLVLGEGARRDHDRCVLADLEELSGLRAIDGKSSTGYSLYIDENYKLASLAGLRNVRGALRGALHVSNRPRATSSRSP